MSRKVIRRGRGETIKISGEALIRVSRRVTLTIVAPAGTRVERTPSKEGGEAPLSRREPGRRFDCAAAPPSTPLASE